MFELKTLSEGINALRSLVSTIKSIIEMLPKKDKEKASQQLAEVEEKLQVAQAQIAKNLGYELCRCTWPPQIMLLIGEAEYGERFRCPKCGREISPDDMPPLKNWRVL